MGIRRLAGHVTGMVSEEPCRNLSKAGRCRVIPAIRVAGDDGPAHRSRGHHALGESCHPSCQRHRWSCGKHRNLQSTGAGPHRIVESGPASCHSRSSGGLSFHHRGPRGPRAGSRRHPEGHGEQPSALSLFNRNGLVGTAWRASRSGCDHRAERGVPRDGDRRSGRRPGDASRRNSLRPAHFS